MSRLDLFSFAAASPSAPVSGSAGGSASGAGASALPVNASPELIAVTRLRSLLDKLSDRDYEFALSLVSQWQLTGRLSDKQWPWVGKLADKAEGKTPAAPARQTVGDLAAVIAMFDRAAAGRGRSPAVVLAMPGGGSTMQIRINVAGEGARVPGSLNVCEDVNTWGMDMRRPWFGRIHRDGTFEASTRTPGPAGLVDLLKAFASDPLKVAAESGYMTKRCCFCNLKLKEPKSVERGYGPVCARKFVG